MAQKKVFVRSAYNYDADAVSDETGLRCEDASLAQQHQAEEADINTIVRRFNLTGNLPLVDVGAFVADFDEIVDFHTAQNRVIEAREAFMKLPADVRNRVDNDPGKFVEWVDGQLKAGNIDELRKAGLAVNPEKVNGTGKDAGNASTEAGAGAG